MLPDLMNLIERTLVPHTAFEQGEKTLEQCFRFAPQSAEPVCIPVIGESRTGKSRLLEVCMSKHPNFRTDEGLNVPILRVATPSKPTVKSLAEDMLFAIGDPLHASGTENAKTRRLKVLLRTTGTRMIMIDEFQHFVDKGSHKVIHHVADWLKILIEDSQVALVVAGLESSQAVLEQNEQLAGRFLAPVILPRFDWLDDEHRSEFLGILGAFNESLAQHFDLPDLTSDEMSFRIYCGTGGLIGYVTKFFRQLVWNSQDLGHNVITMAEMARAHHQSVWQAKEFGGLENPFTSRTVPQATSETLSLVKTIGIKPEEMPPPAKASSRKRSTNLPHILAAR